MDESDCECVENLRELLHYLNCGADEFRDNAITGNGGDPMKQCGREHNTI